MKKTTQDDRLHRIDAATLKLPNKWEVPVTVFANDEIDLQRNAVDELENVLEVQATVNHLKKAAPDFFDSGVDPRVLEIVLTPDFHKGAGIPIGTVLATEGFCVPQAIGNDINCGMRLMATSLTHQEVRGRLDAVEDALRYIFFEGGRDIPMTSTQREALVRFGLPGLIDTHHETNGKGLWRYFDARAEQDNLRRMHGRGSYPTESVFALKDYLECSGGTSYDGIIGNVGGGNHFTEIQYVRKIIHGPAAHAWGLKENQIVIMIHSGSLGVGHVTGNYILDAMRRIYPKGVTHPQNGIFLLPEGDRFATEFNDFRTSMRNSANFAFGNRFFLSLMVRAALETAVGETDTKVVYDAPHNLMWEENVRGASAFVHRKGATPARSWETMADTAYAHWGEPVIVPGSMGSSSYLLLGTGNAKCLCSACHGAGRKISRGAAMHVGDEELDQFLREFRVVTPVDPRRPEVRGRHEIIKQWRDQLKQEAPLTYKEITPVIETLMGANIAQPVVELFPLMTVKS